MVKALIVQREAVQPSDSQGAGGRRLRDRRPRASEELAFFEDLSNSRFTMVVGGFDAVVKPMLEGVGKLEAVDQRASQAGGP